MTRRLATCLGVLALALPLLVAADPPGPVQPEPPLRLKKKQRSVDPAADKKPDDAKKAPAKEDSARKLKADDKGKGPKTGRKLRLPGDGDEPPRKDPAKEAQEALAQAAKEMHEAKERLARKDAGEGTQEIQRDILKRLEKLIKQQQQQDQQQQQAQSGSSSSRRQQSAQRRGQQRNAGQQPQTAQQRRQGQGSEPRPGQGDTAGRGTGREARERMSKIADLYKDVWGSLPETLRQEMDQYSRERFMPKYDDLLKQYYTRVAEKGRRKGQ